MGKKHAVPVFIALFLSIFLFTRENIAYGQAPKFEFLVQKYIELIEIGDKAEAEAYSKREIDPILKKLVRDGKYNIAELHVRKFIKMIQIGLGDQHIELASGYAFLGAMKLLQNDFENAEKFANKSFSIIQNSSDTDFKAELSSLGVLARTHFQLGRYAKAEVLFKRALEVSEKQFGVNDQRTATALIYLAVNFGRQAHYAKAELLLKRALDINKSVFGPNKPEVGNILNVMALNLQYQARFKEAQPFFKRALEIQMKTFGPNQSDTAIILNNLALNIEKLGRHKEAEPLHKRALGIFEKVFGPNNPNAAMSVNNLAFNYHRQARYTEAIPLLRRALATYEKAFV